MFLRPVLDSVEISAIVICSQIKHEPLAWFWIFGEVFDQNTCIRPAHHSLTQSLKTLVRSSPDEIFAAQMACEISKIPLGTVGPLPEKVEAA